jgi:hypothetical protein
MSDTAADGLIETAMKIRIYKDPTHPDQRPLHCIKAKYYTAQKSVIFHSGPDSIAMHSFTTQWRFSQSSKMMMNALLVHHI